MIKPKHLLISFGLALGLLLALLCILGSLKAGAKVALADTLATPGSSPRTCWARLNDDPTDYTTVQAAVDAAEAGDMVKVAGYCTEVESHPRQDVRTYGVVTQVVYISKTVTIQGGYTITNWSNPDPAVYTTTLDAGGEGRVLYATGDVSLTLSGLQITGGDAAGLGGDWLWIGDEIDTGGGIYSISATLTMSDCRVFSNTAVYGAGLYSFLAEKIRLAGNKVFSNTAQDSGGGVALAWSYDVELLDNAIYGNRANTKFGGGISLWYCTTTARDNVIHHNEGGGIFLWTGSGGDDHTLLSHNAILSNTAQNGGGINIWDSFRVTLDGNEIRGNVAQEYGGGVFISFSDINFVGNVIQDNTANDGGGIYMRVGIGSTLINNAIVDNQANAYGGGIYSAGTAVYMEHNTIARNGSTEGVYATTYASYTSSTKLNNTIVSSHTVGILAESGNTVIINGVLWHATAVPTIGPDVLIQNAHIGDPAFAPDGYHITAMSDAIDAGVDAGIVGDIDGQPRPWDAAPDLGADEFITINAVIYLPVVMR